MYKEITYILVKLIKNLGYSIKQKKKISLKR